MARLPLPRRRVLAIGLVAAAALPAALGASPAGATTASDLAAARARVDRTSAQLAAARTAADGQGGAALARLDRIEARLGAQKRRLVRIESALAARHAAETAASQDAAAKAGPAIGAGTPDVIVILPDTSAPSRPVGVAGYTTDPVLNAGGMAVADERPATLTGDDGALAGAIDGYLASKGSPLTGLGATFVSESRAVGLDPRFLVAISGAETSFGTYGPSQTIHNPFGMGPGIGYPSWADAIRAAATNLAGSLYAGDGRVTIGAIQQRWAPAGASNDPTGLNSNWATNVGTYYAQLGGDPLAAVFTGATATAGGFLSATALAPAAAVPGAAQGTLAPPVAYRPPQPVLGESGKGAEAATEAQTMVGTRSVKRGANPDRGFDGAGLVRWAYAREGVTLPRAASEQATVGDPVSPADLQPGDVVFFADPSGYIHHEGVYIGDDLFVQAPGAADVVKVSSLLEPFYAESYAGARRY